jgi:hypothetical protein
MAETLLNDDTVEIDRDIGRGPYGDIPAGNLIAVDRCRRLVAGEDEEDLVIIGAPAETTGGSDAREIDCAVRRAIEQMTADFSLGVHQVRQEEPAAEKGGFAQRPVLPLLDQI